MIVQEVKDAAKATASKAPAKIAAAWRTLSAHELPSWYTANSFVLRGYRPITPDVKWCFDSWMHMHNETVNIYSHLIPAAIALMGNALLHMYMTTNYPLATPKDRLIFHIYLTSSLICFAMSTCYHTLLCHSQRYAGIWVRVDYMGITVQILGSFISGIYMGFYCEPDLQRLHWSIIGGLSVLTAIIVIGPSSDSKGWRSLRLTAFVATGFSAFAPIIHGCTIFSYWQMDKQAGLRYYYLEGVFIMIGVAFYATHFPEAWNPNRYDIWGASHQLFHLCVVLGAVVHFRGILNAYDWNYNHPRCTITLSA